MKRLRAANALDAKTQERLLNTIAEQMKLPFLQIARSAELARLGTSSKAALDNIELAADGALKLLDNYLLGTKLSQAGEELKLEPLSIAEILNGTAHALDKVAKKYGCGLQLHLAGRYEPVMAHRAGLEAALTSLGQVFIEAAAAAEGQAKPFIKLAAHRSKVGIVAGMFTGAEGLSAEVYRRARGLYGQARQPLNQLTHGSGAGIFIADLLLSAMATRLRIAHHQKMTGLAATFMPSRQLGFAGL